MSTASVGTTSTDGVSDALTATPLLNSPPVPPDRPPAELLRTDIAQDATWLLLACSIAIGIVFLYACYSACCSLPRRAPRAKEVIVQRIDA